jgi:NADP-dependent 3-hydroxy acid dehydrogenase YdfG
MNKTGPLASQNAVVTGASSGIGRAIGLALAEAGVNTCLVGRNRQELEAAAADAGRFGRKVVPCIADLTDDAQLDTVVSTSAEQLGGVDILVLCAGVIHLAPMRSAKIEDFDAQYRANVRSPYLLTQRLLPVLRERKGQVVFMNSSVGLSAKRSDVGQFAATMFAVKAITESFREEVNAEGIRVLSVHPGKTATPRQQAFYRAAGREYQPELMLQAADIASTVVAALSLPRTAEVTDIIMRPMLKS